MKATIQVSGNVGVQGAPHLCETILNELHRHSDLVLDLAGAAGLDVATAQLLIAAERLAISGGKSVTFIGLPIEELSRFGLGKTVSGISQ